MKEHLRFSYLLVDC